MNYSGLVLGNFESTALLLQQAVTQKRDIFRVANH